jgi:hypothetical protein
MNNPFDGSQFKGFNTDLLVAQRRGGYKPGTIGVSQYPSRVMQYGRPGVNPLPAGAGVSTMTRVPQRITVMRPQTYSLYTKDKESAADVFKNWYR